jgi:hypothetical protein
MIIVYLTCFYGRPLLEVLYDMRLTIDDNESDTTFEDIINDMLSQDNVMLSVKSTGAICEVNNTEMNLPLRVSDQYATIGDETRPWHIHVNLFETKEARFVIEESSRRTKPIVGIATV